MKSSSKKDLFLNISLFIRVKTCDELYRKVSNGYIIIAYIYGELCFF
ncbi:MAG: hypothetical protein VZQ62_06880 [Methanosphaera sp.]|nr:hypothetical protein [Methanosphaera sp.]MEE3419038.1 hypothetical protein [Methanosphaera sp.]